MIRTIQRFPAVAIVLRMLISGGSASAATGGANSVADPSRIMESNHTFFVFGTGGGQYSSPNGLTWAKTSASIVVSSSLTALIPDQEGVWAPDVIYLNKRYYIYYGVYGSTSKSCAIGLYTTPTLDPAAPNFALTDQKVVLSSTATDTFCTIDPAPVLDADNNLWLAWAGGYTHSTTDNSVWVTRLDNETGLVSAADPAKPGHPLGVGHREGAYLHYHDGYYYLFWQTGSCCSGASSTYLANVARSTAITGPYSGDKIFLQSAGSMHGPGNVGIYESCAADRVTYHYFSDQALGVLGENELSWVDDWPTVAADSTTPLVPCGDGGVVPAAGGSGGSGSAGTGAGGMSAGSGGKPATGSSGSGANTGGDAATGGLNEGDAGSSVGVSGSGIAGGASAGMSSSMTGGANGKPDMGSGGETTSDVWGRSHERKAENSVPLVPGSGSSSAPASSSCAYSNSPHSDAEWPVTGVLVALSAVFALRRRRRPFDCSIAAVTIKKNLGPG